MLRASLRESAMNSGNALMTRADDAPVSQHVRTIMEATNGANTHREAIQTFGLAGAGRLLVSKVKPMENCHRLCDQWRVSVGSMVMQGATTAGGNGRVKRRHTCPGLRGEAERAVPGTGAYPGRQSTPMMEETDR